MVPGPRGEAGEARQAENILVCLNLEAVMDRREFLRFGAGAGLLSAALPSTSGLGANVAFASPVRQRELTRHLASMDHALEVLRQGSLFDEILGVPASSVSSPEASRVEDLCKTSMRSLLVLGMFRDLTEREREHPEVQERIWRIMPEMDEAVFGMAEALGRLGPRDHRRVQDRLKRGPDIVMNLGGVFDRHARGLGVSFKRRAHLRKLLADVSWRMKKQSPMILVDDCLTKVRKMAARFDAAGDEHTLTVARASGDPDYRARLRRLIQGYDASGGHISDLEVAGTAASTRSTAKLAHGSTPVAAASTLMLSPPPQYDAATHRASDRGQRMIGVGGALLGMGLLATAGTIALLDAVGWGILFGTTAGVVLIVAGIVIMIVGAIY